MSITVILQDLASHNQSVRSRAYQALLDRLKSIARRSLSGAPEHEWEDTIQCVGIKLWTMVEDGTYVVVRNDAYLRAMIVYGFRDQIRVEERHRVTKEGFVRVSPLPGDLQHEALSDRELAQRLVERFELLLATIEANRPPRFKENVRQDFDQLVAIAAGLTSMDDAIAEEGVTPASSAQVIKRARDRLLKRHERIRRNLGDAIDLLEVRGEVSSDEAVELRGICALFLRCQRSESADVSGYGSEV